MGWWWVAVGSAWARSDDPAVACRDGAAKVSLAAGGVEVELLRGPNTRFLPAVEAVVSGERGDRPALVVVDLGGPCSRVDAATARSLGLEVPEGGLLEIPAVSVGAMRLTGVRARVDPDAPGLVLSVPGLGSVAGAVLPSEGVVALVPAGEGTELVARVGQRTAVPGRKGAPLRVPGALRWGPVVVDGTFDLRTDLVESRIAASPRLPEPAMRGGRPSYDVGTLLGTTWLADTWIRRDEALSDPSPDFVGALGYDVLFAVDLAVDPVGRGVAFRSVDTDGSHDATAPAVDVATRRYDAEEKAAAGTGDATQGPVDPRATIGFDGPKVETVPLGDPGNPVVRDRNLVLADTLWRAGRLEDALRHYFAAARYAGDHCGAHLDLAVRRMAWAGEDRVQKDLVQKLIDDPLERAAVLWDTWVGLSEGVRAAVRSGNPPPGGVQVDQPESCALVSGLQHRLLAGRADAAELAAFEREHERDAGVAWSRVLGLLDAGQFGPADALLPLTEGGVPPLWRDLVTLRVAAALRQPARAEPLWKNVPGAPTDTPLLSALLVLDAATLTEHPEEWTRKLVRQDPRWVPGQLAHAVATKEPPPPWNPADEARAPGSPLIRCQKAVYLALTGDADGGQRLLDADRRTAEPDWWVAGAVVAHLRGDRPTRDRALAELRWRFPLLPIDRLGLRDPPPPPPPPAPPPRKRK
jgi:hypothetical protein